jgi:GT2 family glycosyltransferase
MMASIMVQISIILLVKNGGAFLEEVLKGIFSQKVEEGIEVVAVDSGSRDHSLEILRDFPVRLKEIPPATFNHGETRNLGASLSQGATLVYLTQDAVPGNEMWLERLVEPLREDPLVAGAFSSHRPRRDCHLMERRQILQTELVSGKTARVNYAVGNPEYERNRFPFVWFSNTSSCLRREVWEKIRFRPVVFAEDQDWAERVLEAGYKTVYVPDSIVIHSHNYRPLKNFKRHFEHAKAMKEIFGKVEFPLFKSIFIATRDSVKADYHFFQSEGEKPRGFMRWFFPSLFWYLSAFSGLWMGSHPEKIPARWRERLALQPSLIKK